VRKMGREERLSGALAQKVKRKQARALRAGSGVIGLTPERAIIDLRRRLSGGHRDATIWAFERREPSV
jgi:hypothetical protein